jgi:hypothetical protein
MRSNAERLLRAIITAAALLTLVGCSCLCSQKSNAAMVAVPALLKPGETWHFAVSGDSRNCGDIVMPAIAQGATQDGAKFYWHLGDLRAIYDFDQDMQQDYKMKGKPLTILDYETNAWDDFKYQQTAPFHSIPFFLGIGNHETIEKMESRSDFLKKFDEFLNIPWLRAQRVSDHDKNANLPSSPQTYYHWKVDGIDFIFLDNASKGGKDAKEPAEFDANQMDWLRWILNEDATDKSINTVVVGMHAALPYSVSAGHSMNEWEEGVKTGTQVYKELLALQNDHQKKVFVLASHSHFYMEGIFNTQYWRTNGGVLPGWIVGTAGAVRYPLPAPNDAKVAKAHVYGYLLGTVNPPGQPDRVSFEFKELAEKDVPSNVVQQYSVDFVHQCFAENPKETPAPAGAPAAKGPTAAVQH